MILLLGGTSETVPIARALTEQGFAVLLSSATDIPLRDPLPHRVRRHIGPLDADRMTELIRGHTIEILVDATHPYACGVTATARAACQTAGLPYLRFERPPTDLDPKGAGILRATDHRQAALLACQPRLPVLLTIGSHHVGLYTAAARDHGLPLWARVLDHPTAIAACREAGLHRRRIITGRGPFSEAQNNDLIRRYRIGVLVTKESGDAGGFPAKIAAARRNKVVVVIVERPDPDPNACHTLDELIQRIVTIRCPRMP